MNSDPLPPPRYSLRTLLLGVTLCCVFFGSFWWLSPSLIAAGSAVGLMIAAHVLGNSMGTQLRDRAGPRRRSPDARESADVSAGHAPQTHLGQRSELGWGMILLTAAGALVGIIGGCWWMESTYHIGFDLSGLAVAATAFGVLAGFASFALATFSQVLLAAFWQALRHK
jgi:hypothetical protein